MIHLTEDELLELAEATEQQLFYSDAQLTMLAHMESCPECYRKFCCARMLSSVTGEYGFLTQGDLYPKKQEERIVGVTGEKILASVSFAMKQLTEGAKATWNRLESVGSVFSFRPVPQPTPALALRSVGRRETAFFEFEDVNDKDTWISIDTRTNTLSIQISTKRLENKNIRVLLKRADGDAIPIQPEPKQKPGFWSGHLDNLPADAFQILIEEAE